MKKQRALVCLLAAVALTTGLAFKFQSSEAQKQNGQTAQSIPDYEVYHQLFHHHVAMKKKAGELEKLGNDGKFLRGFYQREAKLSNEEARVFDDIASSCDEEVAKQDTKAAAIIDEALARNGEGKLAEGTSPPEPPAELKTLWDQRNAIILRARERLQFAFGAQEFERFERFVKSNVEPRITSTPANRQRPSTPMGPRHQPHLESHPQRGS